MMELWDCFVAVLKPWVDPPGGGAADRLEALEGHEGRVRDWLVLRRRHGIIEKAHYLHDLVAHGHEVVDFFKVNLPGMAPQDFNCEMQEGNNKLVKIEAPPLLPMLRNKKPKNTFFYIM